MLKPYFASAMDYSVATVKLMGQVCTLHRMGNLSLDPHSGSNFESANFETVTGFSRNF